MDKRKVTIIGDGAVGSVTAYSLLLNSSVREIAIVDSNADKALGDALDMADGNSLLPHPKDIRAGGYEEVRGAKVVIIAAGAAQKPGETRLDLLRKNASIISSVASSIRPYLDKEAVVLILSNPVDVLTALARRLLDLPKERVIGSGTVLDTMRLKALLSESLEVNPRSIHTYVLGEHGDSEVPIFSLTRIGGLSLEEWVGCKEECGALKEKLASSVRDQAYRIIEKKGATNYAIALAASRIVTSIIDDERSILSLSVALSDQFGGLLDGVSMSLPAVLGSSGIVKIIEPPYSEEEETALIASGLELKKKIAESVTQR